MTFLYPIGLLGLIGIPILIIVYLIKNRYTEQTIASTYMWRLSERFIKRRNPFSRFTGIISLILQLLLVLTLSFAVAHPIITLPGAAREYCFILDSSASMNMQTGNKTRFDRAKDEITKVMLDAKDGSVFSLITVNDSSEVIFERIDNKEKAISRLDNVKCSDSISDYTDAMIAAQTYFNDNPSLLAYLVTDADYEESKNIEVINVAKKETNVSLEGLRYVFLDDGTVIISGNVASYGAPKNVSVNLFFDGSDTAEATTRVYAEADGKAAFSFTSDNVQFRSLTVKLDADDAYSRDNEATVYNEEKKNSYSALIVSDTPFFLEAAIKSGSNAEITVMSTKDYISWAEALSNQDKKVEGYSLYVYDAINPVTIPEDGSVWFVGVNGNVPDSGFSVQGEIVFDDGAKQLTLTSATSSTVRKLTRGMVRDDISISKYIKCGLYSEFTTIYSYLGNPVVFTGLNTYGNREVVFSFNLHDSDFVLSLDYAVLTKNLLDYSFPEIMETTEYFCGDIAEINVISGCESIRVEAPSGEIIYADTSSSVSELRLTEVGEYKITVNLPSSERELRIYSSVPMEERAVSSSFESVVINGDATDEGVDGKFDPMVLLFVMAALLFTAEWMVYCYDKYQLR